MSGSGSPWRLVEALREHALGAVVLHQQPLGVELVDHDGQPRVVEALAHGVLRREQDAEQLVDLGCVAHALGHEDAPQPHGLGIAALQQHHPTAAALDEGGIAVELPARRGVELVEVTHAEGLRVVGAVHVEQVLDEHAEGRPPVPDVVLPQHRVAHESEHAGQRVADQRAAQVTDVHLLGHVGRGIVDDDGGRLGRRLDAEARVGREGGRLGRHEGVGEGQVDETGPADLDHRADVVEIGRRQDLLGHLHGRTAQLLAQGQGAVGLEVGSVRRPQHRVGAGRHRVERGLQALQEHAGGVGHPSFSHARDAASQPCGAPMAPSSSP